LEAFELILFDFRLLKLLELQATADEENKPFPCFGVNLLMGYLLPLATFCLQTKKGRNRDRKPRVY